MPATLDDLLDALKRAEAQRDRELAARDREILELARINQILRDQDGRSDRARNETACFGVDAALQLVSSDPYRSLGALGLRVPPVATSLVNESDPNGLNSRYLFVLDSVDIAEEQRIRVRGARQGWAMAADMGNQDAGSHYPNIFEVTDPRFRLPDGNISWHMTFHGFGEEPANTVPFGYSFAPPTRPQASNCDNFAFQFSKARSLLWDRGTTFPTTAVDPIRGKPDFYTSLNHYVPPRKGRPWGSTLQGGFSTRYDQFTPWLTPHAWDALDFTVPGPGTILFSASVRQNDASTNTPAAARPNPYFPLGDTPAQQFVWNYLNSVQIWSVAGAIIWEDVS